MYRLLTVLLILGLLVGCTVPEIEPENPIDCDGHYTVRFQEWQHCLCPSCEVYDKGTYWINYDDERMFLIGEPVLNPIEVFGECPVDYIYEIELEG